MDYAKYGISRSLFCAKPTLSVKESAHVLARCVCRNCRPVAHHPLGGGPPKYISLAVACDAVRFGTPLTRSLPAELDACGRDVKPVARLVNDRATLFYFVTDGTFPLSAERVEVTVDDHRGMIALIFESGVPKAWSIGDDTVQKLCAAEYTDMLMFIGSVRAAYEASQQTA